LITRPREAEPLDPRLLTVIALPEAPKATRKTVIVSAASPGNPLRGEAFESRDENPKTGPTPMHSRAIKLPFDWQLLQTLSI